MIRLFIADDHTMFREGIRLLLQQVTDFIVAGEASNGDEALHYLMRDQWDVALLDVTMPGHHVMDILRHIRAAELKVRVIILTMHNDESLALRYLKVGAHGFLTKDCDPALLIEAIRRVMTGRRFLTQDLSDRLLDVWHTDPNESPHQELSNRELMVLCGLASGKNLSEIAREQGLSPRTISTYRSRLLLKMGMTNNAELTRYALANGLVM
jgi:DNA-binding NarL/FixJ family response regulator